MVNMAWLAPALFGWTPCLLLVSLLPSQVPGEACRLGRGPGEPAESILTMPCPALHSPRTRFSLGGRGGIRAVDGESDREASKKGLTAVFVSLLLIFEMVSVQGKVTE